VQLAVKSACGDADSWRDVESAPISRTPLLAWLRQSLARDLAALVVGLCLVAAILTALTSREVLDSAIRHSVRLELEREFERAQTALQLWRRQEAGDAHVFARDDLLLEALARGEGARGALRTRLEVLFAREPKALGIALARSGARDPFVVVGHWGRLQWQTALAQHAGSPAAPAATEVDGLPVDLRGVQIATRDDAVVMWFAFDPLLALTLLDGEGNLQAALMTASGETLAGSRVPAGFAPAAGYHEAIDGDGASFLALRRELAGTPWQLVIARPLPALPANTLLSIVLGSVLTAIVAGGLAFGVGAWRLRPLLDLTEGAGRLAGGDFSVRMPVSDAQDEVQTLARAFNDMATQLEGQRRALEDRNQALLRANEVLEQLSITDGLTHVHNHRHFHDQFSREVKRAERSGQPLCLMLIDIDDFKLLNDRYGHAAGDRVLAEAAQLINLQIRESDYIARYGGEEFALLLPQTPLEGAASLAEKIRNALSERAFAIEGSVGRVTVSIGVALFVTTAGDTFDAADRALYEAKAAGKDCVVSAAPLNRPPAPPPSKRRR
jgi:diguanylate cyclase (GGDEF)-like protein